MADWSLPYRYIRQHGCSTHHSLSGIQDCQISTQMAIYKIYFVEIRKKLRCFLSLLPLLPPLLPLHPLSLLMAKRHKGLLLLLCGLYPVQNVQVCCLHPLLTFWLGNPDPLSPNREFLLLLLLLLMHPQLHGVRTHPIHSSHVDLSLPPLLLLLLLSAKVPKGRLLLSLNPLRVRGSIEVNAACVLWHTLIFPCILSSLIFRGFLTQTLSAGVVRRF